MANHIDSTGVQTGVWLVTCAPGQETYELYGHTALMVGSVDATGPSPETVVYNYGIFSFRQPHFVWRFLRGEPEYSVAVQPARRFMSLYASENRPMLLQRINLTEGEQQTLLHNLRLDADDPAWSYRYDYLRDNCTSRAVEQLERCVLGRVEWPEPQGGKHTYRIIIHESARPAAPWTAMGQDLLLGTECDQPIDASQVVRFSPLHAGEMADRAVIVDTFGVARPMVTASLYTGEAPLQPCHSHEHDLTPTAVTGVLWVLLYVLITCAYQCWLESRRWVKPLCRVIDGMMLGVHALVGCVVTFMYFASSLPAVGSNLLVWFFNPLALVFLIPRYFPQQYAFVSRIALAYGLWALASVCTIPFMQSVPPLAICFMAVCALRGFSMWWKNR